MNLDYMRVKTMRFIVLIADGKSMTKVAEENFTSQPSISDAVRRIEHSFGYPIFVRTGSGISGMTPEGAGFVEKLRVALHTLDINLQEGAS